MKTLLTALACMVALAAPCLAQKKDKPSGGKEVLLVNLEPVESEFGGFEYVEGTLNRKQPNVPIPGDVNVIGWGPIGHWPNGLKIVKSVDPKFEIPEGKPYNAGMQDVFASGGEFRTGVGLLTIGFNKYNYVTFKVPEGAKKFTAKTFLGDDAHYFDWRDIKANQQGVFMVYIDDKEVLNKGIQRLGLERGSGEQFEDIDITIPAGAKQIKFYLESSMWGDQGTTELIISDGKFTF